VLFLIFVCAIVVVMNLYAIVKSWAGGGDVQGRRSGDTDEEKREARSVSVRNGTFQSRA
jgi:hypothetical protein